MQEPPMNLFSTLLVLFGLAVGLLLFVPVVGVLLALTLPLGILFLWFLPILIIVASDRTTGGEKLAWILAIVFFSWFAWIFYFLLAPIGRDPRDRDYRGYRRTRYYEYD
jgi:hypothetical protein